MRKMNIWKWVLAVCFVLTVGTEADAQDWKSILGGVVNAVTDGNTSLTGKKSVEGTWTYAGPDCKFTSDNLLAKAGGRSGFKKD